MQQDALQPVLQSTFPLVEVRWFEFGWQGVVATLELGHTTVSAAAGGTYT